jgi:hypothetical protein
MEGYESKKYYTIKERIQIKQGAIKERNNEKNALRGAF